VNRGRVPRAKGKAMDQQQTISDSEFPSRPTEVGAYIERLRREQCERILLALGELGARGTLRIDVTHEALAESKTKRSVPGVRVRLHLTTEEDEQVFEGKSTNSDRVVGMIDALSKAIPISVGV